MAPRIFDAPVIADEDTFNIPSYEPRRDTYTTNEQNATKCSAASYDLVSPCDTETQKSSRLSPSSLPSTASGLIRQAQEESRERRRSGTQDEFEEGMSKLNLKN